jgi:hypothetical protein
MCSEGWGVQEGAEVAATLLQDPTDVVVKERFSLSRWEEQNDAPTE